MSDTPKFVEIISKQRRFIKEGKFVKGDEDTELPPTGDEEEDIPVDSGDERQPEETPIEPAEPIADTFTDKEIDILNVALQIYRSNPESPIEYKNDFSDMFDEGKYEELLGRLISIADELSD